MPACCASYERRLTQMQARHAAQVAAAKAAEDRLKAKQPGEVRMMKIAQHKMQVEHGLRLAAANTAENMVRGQLHRERIEHADKLASCEAAQNKTRAFYVVQLDTEKTATGELKVQLKAAESQCQQYHGKIEQLEAKVAQVKGDAAVANGECQALVDSALTEVEELQAVVAMHITAEQVCTCTHQPSQILHSCTKLDMQNACGIFCQELPMCICLSAPVCCCLHLPLTLTVLSWMQASMHHHARIVYVMCGCSLASGPAF